MGTRGSFFSLADHAAAREFGRRHYNFFVGLRLLRVVWPVLLGLVVFAIVSGLIVWSPDLPDAPDIDLPSVPVWGWVGIGSGLLILGVVLLRKVSLGFRMFLFRIGL